MTRRFDPRDLLRVRRLQPAGCSLDMEGDVLIGSSPLRLALRGLLPVGPAKVSTLVQGDGDPVSGGLVQARWRRGGRSADLIFIAPDLNGAAGAAHVWHRLVTGACQSLGDRQAERIYAAVDDEDRVALQVFRQLGFVAFTNDAVYRRSPGAPAPRPNRGPVGDAGTVHQAQITSLFLATLPSTVRAHVDPEGDTWTRYPAGGWLRTAVPARVLVGDDGSVAAAWRLFSGPGGWWLQVLGSGDEDVAAAVTHALHDMAAAAAPESPLFCQAPGYDTALNLALRGAHFEPVRRRFLLVKHTTARVLEPEWRSRAAEAGLDVAPSHTAVGSHTSGLRTDER
ncbi:MAG: hypothetical protein ACE5EL_03920 [Anaerolineae bacterium]